MPSRSHGRCKVCRAVTHINSRFGLCAVHMRQRNQRIEQERQDAKARRRLRLITPVLEEDQTMTEAPPPGKPGRRPKAGLTDAQQVEILDAYTTTTEPVQDITTRFGIHPTYIYNILDRVGVSWRRGNPESFATWQANQARNQEGEYEQERMDRVPPEVDKALENMLRPPTVLPARPEPVAPTPSVERRAQSTPLAAFDVTVEGRLRVRAVDMLHAIQMVMTDHPDLRITQISEV